MKVFNFNLKKKIGRGNKHAILHLTQAISPAFHSDQYKPATSQQHQLVKTTWSSQVLTTHNQHNVNSLKLLSTAPLRQNRRRIERQCILLNCIYMYCYDNVYLAALFLFYILKISLLLLI